MNPITRININFGRNKKLAINTITSLMAQIVAILCGFILPRLILNSYGSNVNGLVSSITQFLSVISFLELGIGSVVQASLYKPLVDRNQLEISKIVTSASRFFHLLGVILVIYTIMLCIFYPTFINAEFAPFYTITLILAISISSFAQYFFGVVDSLLLLADQRGYIQYIAQIGTHIINALVCILLIKNSASIQLVKLSSSLVFLLRPLLLRVYVNYRYHVNRHATFDVEPIQQKWNGIAQHIAAVVLDNTDIVVLTILSTLSNVSIYMVYYLVISGVKNLFMSTTNGVRAVLGELWVKKDLKALNSFFEMTEWVIHTSVTIIFGCTATLIVPFVQVYTKNINDVNYIVPCFALLITIANALHCLRLPYNLLILAGGYFRETQGNFIFTATLNLVISVLCVERLGLIGVAIGTLIAMLYQTIWMAWYDSKTFLKRKIMFFIKHLVVDGFVFLLGYFICLLWEFSGTSFWGWLCLAIKETLLWLSISLGVNAILYRRFVQEIVFKIKKCLYN